MHVDLARCRAHWFERQLLTAPKKAKPVDLISRSGYLRTLGGVEAYLALRVRGKKVTRKAIDKAVADRSLQVVPSVRGCIYGVPGDDVPLLLRFAARQARKRIGRDLEKAGVKPAELKRVRAAAREALEGGALLTTELRKAMPDGVVRSLGPAGKKVGLSSALPPALRLLEFDGEVERVLDGDALDSERYRWRPVEGELFAHALDEDDDALLVELARRFFDWFAPATRDHLAAWTGAGKRDAQKAIDALELAEVAVEGWKREGYIPAEDLARLEQAKAADRVVALPFNDNVGAIHGSAALTPPEHHDLSVPVWGRGKPTTLGQAAYVQLRGLVHGGELIGWWEYDPTDSSGVWTTFTPPGKARAAAIEDEVGAVVDFIGTLGHGRSYSLDTDKNLAERAATIRTMRDGLAAG